MIPRLLLDTHIVVRWLIDAKRLTREQSRAIDAAERRSEPMAISMISVLEIAFLINDRRVKVTPELLTSLESDRPFCILPISADIAMEAATLHTLRDPFDQVIAATARVHRLRLVTSGQRIIASQLVPIIQ